jgi:hypothetical protein
MVGFGLTVKQVAFVTSSRLIIFYQYQVEYCCV